MNQMTFGDMEFSGRKKVTQKEKFLREMDRIIPWDAWVRKIQPFYPAGRRGCPPRGIEVMLRMYEFTPDGRPVYHCCQSVVSAFAQDVGYDGAACMKTATCFRDGMQMGSVCGAITGALMALGLVGIDDSAMLMEFYRKLRQNHDGLSK